MVSWARLWCFGSGTLISTSASNTSPYTTVDLSVSPAGRSTDTNFIADGYSTSPPAAATCSAIPLEAKASSAVPPNGLSKTRTRAAPASRASFTTAPTTHGLVVAAYSYARPAVQTFGLMTTFAPFGTKRSIPPSAATARRTSASGSSPPRATAR